MIDHRMVETVYQLRYFLVVNSAGQLHADYGGWEVPIPTILLLCLWVSVLYSSGSAAHHPQVPTSTYERDRYSPVELLRIVVQIV